MTLDGVMQAPGGPDEDRDGGIRSRGWSFLCFSEDMGEVISDAFEGRRVHARPPDV
jgi:hypothetical protein